ncbi:MAG: hypothetical protein HOO97_06230 [Sideroxydans sp.]|nr:hypothetical protein [Sideroxydans sp.]
MNAPTKEGQLTPEIPAQALSLPIISVERFSELTGFPEGVLRGWIARGYMPTYRIGKYTAVNVALLNYMAMQKAPSL